MAASPWAAVAFRRLAGATWVAASGGLVPAYESGDRPEAWPTAWAPPQSKGGGRNAFRPEDATLGWQGVAYNHSRGLGSRVCVD